MKTIGKIGKYYFLLNALAFIYLGFTIENTNGQLFFICFLVFVCLFAAYIIHSGEQFEKEIDEKILNNLKTKK